MIEAAALIVVAIVTVAGSVVTNLQARKTANSTAQKTVAGSIETSRIAAEEQAYQRAKSFYEGVIDRQDREIKDLEGDVERLRGEVSGLRGELDSARTELDGARAELETAKAALRLKFPDEP